MKPLYTEQDFNKTKSTELLPLECYVCGTTFLKLKRVIRSTTNLVYGHSAKYCSQKCCGQDRTLSITVNCANCNKEIPNRQLSHLKQIKNSFCSKSCAATYNNLHKTTGARRSKLEVWLEKKLAHEYPTHQILYCNKTTIDAELDIYFPNLKLAFELNGIYHYEPIHGQPKLDQVQANDHRKYQACLEHGIDLVIIDVSGLKYFKEQNCQKYLDIIKDIIDSRGGGS